MFFSKISPDLRNNLFVVTQPDIELRPSINKIDKKYAYIDRFIFSFLKHEAVFGNFTISFEVV